jgi:enoyl-CoA hydratase/carnithine racemase
MDIHIEQGEGLLTLTLNRPAYKNALTHAMYTTMSNALQHAENDKTIKVVLIKGQGTCFTSGNDLNDFLNNPPNEKEAPALRFLHTLSNCPQPLVAQVEGLAVGVGSTLLLHCDLVYASTQASFSMPFVRLGLCPEGASSALLPLVAGYQKAAQWLLLGDTFTAQQANEAGLVTSVLPPQDIEAHVQTQLTKLLNLPAHSLRESKKLMKMHLKAHVTRTIEQEANTFLSMIPRPEAQEAFRAFGEKRQPNFRQFDHD